MAKTTYAEKLKDVRWQKKRLKILERDDWTCQWCFDDKSTLHVHHTRYCGEPWEAEDLHLVTVCETCHEKEDKAAREKFEKLLIDDLRRRHIDDTIALCVDAGFSVDVIKEYYYTNNRSLIEVGGIMEVYNLVNNG